MSELPTSANIDKLLKYLPIFEKPDFDSAKIVSRPGEFPWVDYAPEVNEFLRELSKEGFIQPFPWPEWQSIAEEYVQYPEKIDSLDLETIQKLLTLHVRKERFCDGHLQTMFNCGHIVFILRRLRTIRSMMEP